jgi:O-antigen/teichoic acid export membrane protein
MTWRQVAAKDVTPGLSAEFRRPPSAKRAVAYLTGGNLFSTLLLVAGGLLIGRLVEPATLGRFNGISLALAYASLLGLGVTSGLSRELPYFIGKGDRARAEQLAATAQAWTLIVGSLLSLALLVVGIWFFVHGDWWGAAGWLTNGILAVQIFYSDYLQMTYRTTHDFGRFALIKVVQQTALVGLILLVVPLDFYGLCLRVLVSGALALGLLHRWRPIRRGPSWKTVNWTHLLKIGLPMFIVWKVFDYWAVINQTLVLKLGGTHSLGLFAMVIMAAGAIQAIPQAAGQVLFPRMTERFGTGQTLTEVARGYIKPVAATMVVVVPVVLLAWWLVGPLTRFLVPQYAEAVPAIQWALPLAIVSCFESIYALFTIRRRQGLRLASIITGIAAYAGSLFLLVRGGVYLAAFSQAMLIGRMACVVVSYCLIFRMLARE